MNRQFMRDRQPYGYMGMGGAAGIPSYPQGASLGQWIMQVTVGGILPTDGEKPPSCYNALTKMMLRASARLPLTAPCLSLRVHSETPADLLREAAQCLLSGGAHPLLIHDEKIIPGLQNTGENIGLGVSPSLPDRVGAAWQSRVSLEDARNFVCDGCYEPIMS